MRNLLTILALLAPLPLQAGALSDLLMAPGVLAAAPAGAELVYAEDLTAPEGAVSVEPVTDGRVLLAVVAAPDAETRELRLMRGASEAAAPEPVGTFAAGVANPVLLYFLETTVRVMAEATGGSPYYIRNRIREALAEAGVAPGEGAQQVALEPFAADPNRGRMGDFSDLEIRLRFDPAAPARILELSADTASAGSGYHQRMVLIPEEE